MPGLSRSHAVSLVIVGGCLSALTSPAIADARAQASAECRKAVMRQGHEKARFDSINAMEGRNGTAVIGEITDGDGRYAFRCNFDRARKLVDAPVTPIAPASAHPAGATAGATAGPATSATPGAAAPGKASVSPTGSTAGK